MTENVRVVAIRGALEGIVRRILSAYRRAAQVPITGDVYALCNAPSYLAGRDLDAPMHPAEALFRRAPGETLHIGPKGVAEVQIIGRVDARLTHGTRPAEGRSCVAESCSRARAFLATRTRRPFSEAASRAR